MRQNCFIHGLNQLGVFGWAVKGEEPCPPARSDIRLVKGGAGPAALALTLNPEQRRAREEQAAAEAAGGGFALPARSGVVGGGLTTRAEEALPSNVRAGAHGADGAAARAHAAGSNRTGGGGRGARRRRGSRAGGPA